MNYSDLTDVSVKFAVRMEGCATAVVTLTSLFPFAIMGTLSVKLNLEVSLQDTFFCYRRAASVTAALYSTINST